MQNRLGITLILHVLLATAFCGPAFAQQTQIATGEQPVQPQVNTEPAPQPQAQPQPIGEPAPQPPLVGPAQSECVPKCRTGYICRQGECISLCNPPCASDETCNEAGACVSKEVPSQHNAFEAEGSKPGYQHRGFFLRLTYGLGWSNAEVSYEIENAGFSQFLGFDIGGAVSENLILHARMSGLINHVDEEEVIDLNDERIELKVPAIGNILFGGGLTYYIMPFNIYMTFVLGLAVSGFSYEEKGLSSDDEEFLEEHLEQPKAGVGFNFDFGKEWWVGREWGLGIAGRFSYSSVSPNESAETDDWLNCVGLGVLFTTTLN